MSYTQALWNERVRIENNIETAQHRANKADQRVMLSHALLECRMLARIAREGGDADLEQTFDELELRCNESMAEL